MRSPEGRAANLAVTLFVMPCSCLSPINACDSAHLLAADWFDGSRKFHKVAHAGNVEVLAIHDVRREPCFDDLGVLQDTNDTRKPLLTVTIDVMVDTVLHLIIT